MIYDLTYSLRIALDAGLPELSDVQILYADTDLTQIQMPFATVEYLQGGGDLVSAGRVSYVDTFRYQLGLFAGDVNEMYQLEDRMRNVIRDPDGHPLYVFNSTTGAFELTSEVFVIDDNGYTPIGNDDSSANTYDFHGYFDVEIKIY